ncbi:MAG: hypothetical protein ACRC4V_08480 [Aeromonas veronii]
METKETIQIGKAEYDRLMAIANDVIHAKTEHTLGDWIADYGGRTNEKGYLEFGSVFALSKMLERRDKEILRNILSRLVED